MQTAKATLKDYFQSELAALRVEGCSFAENYPQLAQSLGLNSRAASDPQVELLMQSFAFLTGRLQYQAAQDRAALPNALLGFLYPHLEAPIPSMLVAEIQPKPNGSQEQILARGRYLTAQASNHLGLKMDCRFRTCYDTPLLPLKIEQIELQSAYAYPFLQQQNKVQSVLTIRLRADGIERVQQKGKGPERLRFFIDNSEPNALPLYEMLALNLQNIIISIPNGNSRVTDANPIRLPPEVLRWLGNAENEAMLPANPHTHPGYRLLQEYFAFPEKFLFFEIDQIGTQDFSKAQDSFELLFLLDAPFDKNLVFNNTTVRLNCVPLVNLFSRRIDPLALDHTQYEYHLLGDLENHRYCEIYAIEALESITAKGKPRPIAPYFAMDDYQKLEQQDYFYVTRRVQSQGSNIAGSELLVSFLDEQFDLTQLRDEVIGGRALCSNRRLPEQLMNGTPMQLEGPGPVSKIQVLSKPTPHFTAAMTGERPWSLVSQLALNQLSLTSDPKLSALKDILRLHVGPGSKSANKQIDGISGLRSRPVMRHVNKADGWRGFVRGSELQIQMDRAQFEEHSPVLFCAVLRHFLCLYATVNNLVEVSLETSDIKGSQNQGGKTQWQPLPGAKPIL